MPKKKLVLIIVGGLLVLFLAIQLIPYGHNHNNPPVQAEPPWDSPQTRETFYRACGDCHSNETVWPWYSNIAPVSWLVMHDVEEGRSRFNVSEWGRARQSGDEAAGMVQEGEMPPGQYLLMHPNARLSDQEKAVFVPGLTATFGQ
jgi:hypothetical protein